MNLQAVSADADLYRVHSAAREAIHYCNCGGCRFDPVHAGDDAGALYVSTSPMGAFIEKFGRFRTVTDDLFADFLIARVSPASDVFVLDLTDRAVLGAHGLSAEYQVGASYSNTQSLAGEAAWRGDRRGSLRGQA